MNTPKTRRLMVSHCICRTLAYLILSGKCLDDHEIGYSLLKVNAQASVAFLNVLAMDNGSGTIG